MSTDFKSKLLSEKKSTLARMKDIEASDPFLDPDYLNDNAAIDTDAREQEQRLRIEAELESLNKRLSQINIALELFDKGLYGVCKKCGKKIPEKRLELVPEAIYCVDCEASIMI